jgi:hypothetical protein
MTKLPYLRAKKAKGRTYYYFDLGNDADGRRVLSKLPDIRDPRFGDCYAGPRRHEPIAATSRGR